MMQHTSNPSEQLPEQPQIALEYARLAQEEMLRLKELGIQEKQLEVEAAERRFSWLASPAVVAIVAGLIGYLSTLYSTYATRQLEAKRQEYTEKLEQEKHQATLQLAREKQEGTLILEAIKSEGTREEKERAAAANLVFLADAGLITSLKKEELGRLRAKAGNALPSLSSGVDLDFRRSSSLTDELQVKLQKELGGYQQYLIGLGYDPELAGKRIPVQIDEEQRHNAFFDGEAIHIGKDLAGDPEYAFSALTWVVLKRSNPEVYKVLADSHGVQLAGFAQALKFYFTCSYRNDPHVGKNYWGLTGLHAPPDRDPRFLFNLTTSRKWSQTGDFKAMEEHQLGELWGAGLWELRDSLGQKTADQLVFTTWKRLKPVKAQMERPKFYVDAILAAADAIKAQVDHQLIRQVFVRRNLG
jgi:hypothetical protein